MTKEEVLEIVEHVGDVYRVRTTHVAEPFALYVSEIGIGGLIQKADEIAGLTFMYVNFYEIESIELL